MCPTRGGAQNGPVGWSGSLPVPIIPLPGTKSRTLYSGRKPGSGGISWGVEGGLTRPGTLRPFRDGYGGASELTLIPDLPCTPEIKTSASANTDTSSPPR